MFYIYHSADADISTIAEPLALEGLAGTVIQAVGDAEPAASPSVLLVSPALRGEGAQIARYAAAGGAVVLLGAPGETDAPQTPGFSPDGWVPWPQPPRALLLALRSALWTSARRLSEPEAGACTADTLTGLQELVELGTLLATERDYGRFFDEALTRAMRVAKADGGSLYLVEGAENERRLRFMLAKNFSRPEIAFSEYTLPLTHDSIAGHVALTQAVLNLDDAYSPPEGMGFTFNRAFDEANGYRTKSMLTMPMVTHSGEIVGVLQLVNRKRSFSLKLDSVETTEREALPFDQATIGMISALGAQVAVCLDNNRLYDEIHALFEGFVTASVLAIEQRDPTTSGHSARVAGYTVALAEAVDRSSLPRFSPIAFSVEELREIRYAGLLHDFGKVGVREEVLVKPTKLQPWQLEIVKRRHAFLRRTAERDHYRARALFLEERGREGYAEFRRGLDSDFAAELNALDSFLRLVLTSNIPTVLPEGDFEALNAYAARFFDDADGADRPFLEPEEVRFLSIRKGSLDERERLEVESHVTKTYQFLSKIPWTRNLRNVPDFAYGHHEKLNGQGYPRRLPAGAIPIQTRMMTISDIYDALTASDRPYKRAVPVEKALDILNAEADAGMLDRDLTDLFIGAKLYGIAG